MWEEGPRPNHGPKSPRQDPNVEPPDAIGGDPGGQGWKTAGLI